jgi:hypothetical protein
MLTMCKMHIRLTGQAHTHLTLNRYGVLKKMNEQTLSKNRIYDRN